MARIKKLKENGKTVYPATIWNAVVDPTTGGTLKDTIDVIQQFIVAIGDALESVDAKTLNGHGIVTAGELDPKNKIPVVGNDGVMEIGRYLDFHMDGSKEDYNIRLRCDTTGKYQLYLPAKTGTVALTSDIPDVIFPYPIIVPVDFDTVDHQAYFGDSNASDIDYEDQLPLYFQIRQDPPINRKGIIPVTYFYDTDTREIEFYFTGSDGDDAGVWYGKGSVDGAIGISFKG